MVKGYKVFNSDWTCRDKQYTCPGKFEEEGDLKIYVHGMHFCQAAADCFNYYDFDNSNKVAEVIAYGKVITEGDRSCTDKLEIIREIPWDEVLQIVNTGKNCTGYCNTGNNNTGKYNTGHYNTGSYNTKNWNAGDYNAGTGNVGSYNIGSGNTGNYNTGNWNTGIMNHGDDNTGSYNTGHGNTGNDNIGSCNTGDWNKSSFNVGCFNTKEQTIMLFNKPSNMTYYEWLESEARRLLNQMPKNIIDWVWEEDMTEEEKKLYPTYETTSGYLKVLDEFESCQKWWDNLIMDEQEIIKSIPNFDPDIFYECTHIRVK